MMSTDLLYLHHQHSWLAGQSATIGNLLLKGFRDRFDYVSSVHCIDEDEKINCLPPLLRADSIGMEEIRRRHFNVIYCEGGPYSDLASCPGGRAWKIPPGYAERFAIRGNILIFADIDRNFAASPDAAKFQELAGIRFRYGDNNQYPIYFVDKEGEDRSDEYLIRLKTDSISPRIPEWIRPCFDGVSELLVWGPLEIDADQTSLAYVSGPSIGTLCNDTWWSPPQNISDFSHLYYHPNGPHAPDLWWPFASVRKLGRGFVVAITGSVSPDRIVNRCPGNVAWIINLITLLQATISENANNSPFDVYRDVTLFLSHRSLDKPLVEEVRKALRKRGPDVWYDKDRIIPSDSLGLSINGGLAGSSHFVVFWSKHCVNAKWIDFELGSAIHSCVEHGKPIFVVKLDETSLPPAIDQYLRIQGGADPDAIAVQIVEAIDRLRERKE